MNNNQHNEYHDQHGIYADWYEVVAYKNGSAYTTRKWEMVGGKWSLDECRESVEDLESNARTATVLRYLTEEEWNKCLNYLMREATKLAEAGHPYWSEVELLEEVPFLLRDLRMGVDSEELVASPDAAPQSDNPLLWMLDGVSMNDPIFSQQ